MGCCNGSGVVRSQPIVPKEKVFKTEEVIATKSEDKTLVHLRYYGGGMIWRGGGCCSQGGGGYSIITSETIQFPSDDAPSGFFSKRFDTSHDYYVTQKQAEMLLKETYRDATGKEVHKFKIIEE